MSIIGLLYGNIIYKLVSLVISIIAVASAITFFIEKEKMLCILTLLFGLFLIAIIPIVITICISLGSFALVLCCLNLLFVDEPINYSI